METGAGVGDYDIECAEGGEGFVDCPNDVDVKTGATFTCDLKLQNGKSGTITITQLDDKGHVRWQVNKVS